MGPDAKWLFREAEIDDLDIDALSGPDTANIKENATRLARVVEQQGRRYFIKIERPGWGFAKNLLRRAFKGSWRLAREARLQRDAHAAGVPVPRPLGLRRYEGGWLFVSEAVDATPLADLYAAAPVTVHLADGAWRSLMEALLRLRAWGRGHGDLHAGNVLIGRDRVWLIDVGSAAPARHDSLDDLAALCASLHLKLPIPTVLHWTFEYFNALGLTSARERRAGVERLLTLALAKARAATAASLDKPVATRRRNFAGGEALLHKHFDYIGVDDVLGLRDAQRLANAAAREVERRSPWPADASVREVTRDETFMRQWGRLRAVYRALPHGPAPVALVEHSGRRWLVQARHREYREYREAPDGAASCMRHLNRFGLAMGDNPETLGLHAIAGPDGTAFLCEFGERLRTIML